MSEYEDIRGSASKQDRIIRIYKNRVVLNARAGYVLYNPANPYLGFRVDGHNRVFIMPEAKSWGFHVTTRKLRSSSYINSVRLCRILIEKLGGKGAYKIEELSTKFPDGLGYRILPERLIV